MIDLHSNRPVSWINCSVSSRICRFNELGKSSSPYNKSCNRASFLRFTYPSGRNNENAQCFKIMKFSLTSSVKRPLFSHSKS